MVTVVWQIWSMGCFFDCLPYEWQSGTSDGLFLPIYPPRGMHSSTLLWGLINFCNKYMSSLWLMWVHGLYTLLSFRNLLAFTVPCIALSHIETWCKLRRCIQTPWYEALYHISLIISSSKQPPYLPIMAFPWPFRDILPCNFHRFRLMTWAFIVILLCMII